MFLQTSPLACAGHSLGGALATLAAMDIRKACPDEATLDISCYTFGAPRTGNHAFAYEYNELVPDTWGIINDQVSPGRPARSLVWRLIRVCQRSLPAASWGLMTPRPSSTSLNSMQLSVRP
jgi:hypothetical protein